MDERRYRCVECGRVRDREEWNRATDEYFSTNRDCVSDPSWDIATAHPGDSCICPVCGWEEEVSEVEVV